MARHQIRVTVNGAAREAEVDSRLLLVHLLRDVFRLTGTHVGCDTTHCGACTVLLDGAPVKSCTIQEGFWEMHGLQCGYCTPGMMMSSYALLQRTPTPTELEIRQAISGNLCRCTGYVNIVKAVEYAAEKLRKE